jgi:hypothetical protein
MQYFRQEGVLSVSTIVFTCLLFVSLAELYKCSKLLYIFQNRSAESPNLRIVFSNAFKLNNSKLKKEWPWNINTSVSFNATFTSDIEDYYK